MRIDNGDYVIVIQQSTANNGNIVVALIDGKTTLKRLCRNDNIQKIILHLENEEYNDIEYDELEIQEIAVYVIKKI